MRTLIGAIVVAAGVLLLVYGIDSTECLSTRVSRILHLHPEDRSVWVAGAGLVTVLIGMALAYSRGRSPRI